VPLLFAGLFTNHQRWCSAGLPGRCVGGPGEFVLLIMGTSNAGCNVNPFEKLGGKTGQIDFRMYACKVGEDVFPGQPTRKLPSQAPPATWLGRGFAANRA